jgi:H+/Cl- antiporter ClcA
MKRYLNPVTHFRSLRQLVHWMILVVPVAVLSGSASALFSWSLYCVTKLRWNNEWLVYFLPVAGFIVALGYTKIGKKAETGNNLIIDEIHSPGGGVPLRMTPLILVSTLISHLFGASVGREGTALQMGGSLAAGYGKLFSINKDNTRILLIAGIAAGFGSIFGTPLAGGVFALEVLVIGRMQYDALIPVFFASLLADQVCRAWGIHHETYGIMAGLNSGFLSKSGIRLLAYAVLSGITFGLISRFFSELSHTIKKIFSSLIRYEPLRPFLGGIIIIALTYFVGTTEYMGLSVVSKNQHGISLVGAFTPNGVSGYSWLWKLIFTALALGSGFKGGEVTPLFFIGAALGHAIAVTFGLPIDLFAALGFIAVFAGASNTPLACTLLGAELFGAHYLIYYAIVCFLAYHFSGHAGIYESQRVGVPKTNFRILNTESLPIKTQANR